MQDLTLTYDLGYFGQKILTIGKEGIVFPTYLTVNKKIDHLQLKQK